VGELIAAITHLIVGFFSKHAKVGFFADLS
jgi:hypothetical protein